MREHLYAIQHWLWFGLGMSFLPIVFTVWKLYDANNSVHDILISVTSHGEVLLICMSTLGVGMGELIKNTKRRKAINTSLIALAMFLAFFCVFAFSEASTTTPAYFFKTSTNVLFATIAVTISTLIATTKKR